jgi:hypothetical protein
MKIERFDFPWCDDAGQMLFNGYGSPAGALHFRGRTCEK